LKTPQINESIQCKNLHQRNKVISTNIRLNTGKTRT